MSDLLKVVFDEIGIANRLPDPNPSGGFRLRPLIILQDQPAFVTPMSEDVDRCDEGGDGQRHDEHAHVAEEGRHFQIRLDPVLQAVILYVHKHAGSGYEWCALVVYIR